MSIEQRLEELTKAINTLPDAIASAVNAMVEKSTVVKEEPVKTETPDVSEQPVKGGSDIEPKTEKEVAGRKTYVFDKTTKTGQIVEKGEELPVGDNFVRVGKTKWEQICEKYNLNVETGLEAEAEEEAATETEEDFDDLDNTEEEGEQEESGEDDDMDLGLDDEEESKSIDPTEVKQRMVQVMREVGREDALKLFKKVGARNFGEVKKEDLPKLYDLAGKALENAGK